MIIRSNSCIIKNPNRSQQQKEKYIPFHFFTTDCRVFIKLTFEISGIEIIAYIGAAKEKTDSLPSNRQTNKTLPNPFLPVI